MRIKARKHHLVDDLKRKTLIISTFLSKRVILAEAVISPGGAAAATGGLSQGVIIALIVLGIFILIVLILVRWDICVSSGGGSELSRFIVLDKMLMSVSFKEDLQFYENLYPYKCFFFISDMYSICAWSKEERDRIQTQEHA